MLLLLWHYTNKHAHVDVSAVCVHVGSGSLAAMAVFESLYKPDMQVCSFLFIRTYIDT